MRDTLESWADAAMRWSPAQPLFQWRAARRLRVLAYHAVTHAARFERQMRYVARALRPVSIADVREAARGGRALPRRAVLVTFDDGHRSVLETAAPILKKHRIPGVVYVVTSLLDTEQPFWWEEARHLARHGGEAEGFEGLDPKGVEWALKEVPNEERKAAIRALRRTASEPAPRTPQLRTSELSHLEAANLTVGNHTHTHPCLDQCRAKTVSHEIAEAHDVLSSALGRAPTSFTYPNGNADERAAGVLADLGYETAFLFDHRLSSPTPAPPFRISRLRVNAHTSMDRFRTILSGLHPALYHMRRRS